MKQNIILLNPKKEQNFMSYYTQMLNFQNIKSTNQVNTYIT